MNQHFMEDRSLDKIFDEMTNTVEKSKDEIFHLREKTIKILINGNVS